MSGDTWGPKKLLELDNELLKGELGIDVHRQIMPQLLKRCKEIEERRSRWQSVGQASKSCLEIMIV